MQAAQGVDAAVPMGGAAEALYQAFTNLGGAQGFLGMIKLLDGSWRG